MINLKQGVDCRFLRKELVERLFNIYCTFDWHTADEYEFVITSGSDGQHRPGSKHYRHGAIDIRTRYTKDGQTMWIPRMTLEAIRIDLQRILGEDFDILIEKDHIHIEYDPC